MSCWRRRKTISSPGSSRLIRSTDCASLCTAPSTVAIVERWREPDGAGTVYGLLATHWVRSASPFCAGRTVSSGTIKRAGGRYKFDSSLNVNGVGWIEGARAVGIGFTYREWRCGDNIIAGVHRKMAVYLNITASTDKQDLVDKFAVLDKQWQQLCGDSILSAPHVLRNLLTYKIYHCHFPDADFSTIMRGFTV